MGLLNTPHTHSPYEELPTSPTSQQAAIILEQYKFLIKSGKDPNVFSSRIIRLQEFDPDLYELAHLKRSMARMEADYACVEVAARVMRETAQLARDTKPQMPTSPSGTNHMNTPSTRHNAAVTIEWLRTHYEEQSGISLPRGAMFGHYLEYCRQVALEPINQATFGKVIRTVFPGVKSRRLGGRGQSKYHYYGMAIKSSSPYKEIMMSAQRVNNYFGEPTGKGMYSRTVSQTSLPQMTAGGLTEPLQGSVLLKDFPAAYNIRFPEEIKDTMAVFMMMYRHHSQRVIDTILRADLADVKEFVVHFWQSLPAHINAALRNDLVVRTVALCDKVLYEAVVTLLIPGPLQPLPSNLMAAIRTFGQDLISWLTDALKSHPAALRHKKLQVAQRFSKRLWRLTSVSHMAAVARSFLHSHDVTAKLPHDWATLNTDIIVKEVAYDLDLSVEAKNDLQHYVDEFEQLVSQQMTLDQYVNWVQVIYSQTIRKALARSTGGSSGLQEATRAVLLQWVYISKVFIRELSLLSADMFGPYHLMTLLAQDYVMYLTEEWKRQQIEHQLKRSIYGGKSKAFVPDWEAMLCSSPYKDYSLQAACPQDPYHFTPEKANYCSGGGQRQIFSYQHDQVESPPLTQMADLHKRGYASSLVMFPKSDMCDRLHDDIGHEHRAFDDIDHSPSDDHGSRTPLDLSTYNSSFMDDDDLVDKVISKGYATLDDCSPLSPLPWKPDGNHHHTLTQSSAVSLRRTMSQSMSASTPSAVTYHQLFPPQPQMTSSPHMQSVAVSYNQHALHSQPPSPASYAAKTNSYSPYARSYAASPMMLQPESGLLRQQVASAAAVTNYHKLDTQADHKGNSPNDALPPAFTHISASLQVAPFNPRKKWILEEEMRNRLCSTKLTTMSHT